ncbi:nucleoside kinase [Thiospirochaeta perfilievii]|uniref:Nucleoside kinase n=1 Tax=Thiospirochaeta perfilievii TaxID=252967 RepID=A0A5C1QAG2_9SPIO|nr:nucleoside kinase [Thiospirochaeta perfilievii]QEN03786.1 nucleoside kinase [Thiospirochaeta perfilievii]
MNKINLTIDKKNYEVDQYSNLITILEDKSIIAASANNKIISLHHELKSNCNIEPIYIDTIPGSRAYRQTLCFILSMAAKEVLPNKKLIIGHSLGHAFYYYFLDEIVTEDELILLENRMHEIVEEDRPIKENYISWVEAVNYFKSIHQYDTAQLLEYRTEDDLKIVDCLGFKEIYHMPLAPSTGYIKTFDLVNKGNGFLLHFPHSLNPKKLTPVEDMPVIFGIFQDYKKWVKIQEVHCVGKLNELSLTKSIRHFIKLSETEHDRQIVNIASKIQKNIDSVKAILIAGPSSSGKTTFSKKLALALEINGIKPINISLDDYYLPHDKVPVDEFGEKDLETVHALNIPLLNQNLIDLLAGKETYIPINDFTKGIQILEGRKLKLEENNVLIIEGIHALNDELTDKVPKSSKFKIYISALTGLNLDDNNRISSTDNRLLRRMVRDYNFRRYSADNTFNIWPSVNRGEKKYIFPFQGSADCVFNSALPYEIAVLKIYAEPLLRTIRPDNANYNEAVRILNLLSNFTPIPEDLVPSDSLIREFIGKSYFKY